MVDLKDEVDGWTARLKSEDKVRTSVVRTKVDVSTGKGVSFEAGGNLATTPERS